MAENIKIDLLINAAESAKTIGETKKALRDLKSEAMNLKEGTAAFTRVATAAGELQDRIADLSATTKYLGDDLKNIKGIAGIGEGIAGGFAMAQGAAALFGGENKKLEESMVKLQAVMAVIQGMQAIGDVIQKESAATLFIKNGMTKIAIALGYQEVAVKEAAVVVSVEEVALTEAETVAKGAKIVATETEIVVTEGATLAQKALNLAMKMNPIGILIALIIAGVSALMLWSNASSKAADEEKKANEEKKKNAALLKAQNEEKKRAAEYGTKEATSYFLLSEQLKKTLPNTKERLRLIKEINSTYGTTLQNLKDEKTFQDQVNLSVDDYVKFLQNKYNATKNQENMNKLFEKQNALLADQKIKQDLVAESVRLNGEVSYSQVKKLSDLEKKYAKESIESQLATLDTRLKNMATYDQQLTDSAKKTGLKLAETEKATGKAVIEAKKQSELDILSITNNLNEEQKKQLSDLEDWKISNMEEGLEKEEAIINKAAKDAIDSNRKSSEDKIEEAKKVLDKQLAADVENGLISQKTSDEVRQRALADTGKVGKAIADLKKTQGENEVQIELDKNKKLEEAGITADDKQVELDKKVSEKYIEDMTNREKDALNARYTEQEKLGQEYLDQLDKIEKTKEELLKYHAQTVFGLQEGNLYYDVPSITKEGEAAIAALDKTFAIEIQKDEEYSDKRRALEAANTDEQTGVLSEQGRIMIEALDLENKDQLAKRTEYWTQRKALELKYTNENATVLGVAEGDGNSIVYDEKMTYLQNLLALYKKEYGDITEVVTDANVEIANDNKENDQKELDRKKDMLDKMVAIEEAAQQQIMQIFTDSIANREYYVGKEYDAKIAKIDEEQLAYQNLQANRTMDQQIEYDIQQGFENRKLEAQKVRDIEMDKLKKSQFNAQKANDLTTIAINTALAISGEVKKYGLPLAIPFMVADGVLGAVQAGIVASKQYIPSFATGGIFNGTGMVNGPGTGTSDSVNAKLSNGESVINAKSTKLFGPVLSAINQAGGGIAIPHLKSGGVFTDQNISIPMTQQSNIDTQAIVDAIYAAGDRPIETYVKESSITTAQRSKQKLKNRTSF